ncbi:MAG: glycosyltransferase family 4 protein [Phototrophicaceae bacterium]
MKITVFSIVPLFPDYDMGGAQKHLRYIANYLGERGHQVTVLSTKRHDSTASFHWHPNVTVHPILQFKQPFPSPYDTGAHNMANIIQDVVEHLQDADRFYIHDGELLFPYIYQNIPTVVGLRDNVYPETLLGGYLFRGDRLIVISEYSKRFVEATMGRFFPDLDTRLQRINNGLDWGHFKPTEPHKIYDIIPKAIRDDYKIILQPHRPEDSKGIWQVIDMVAELAKKRQDFRVLFPRWLGITEDDGVQEFYDRVDAAITEKGISAFFMSHDWIPFDLLPEYYSLADVTLSLGWFVESFGNAVYESLGCGTPSVVARIATHRELLPEHLVDKVDFGDAIAAAQIVDDILSTERPTSPETMDYLRVHYNFEDQLAQYAETIENAQIREPMTFTPQVIDETTRFELAPWCYASGDKIYHDFRADYTIDPNLIKLLDLGIRVATAKAHGISGAEFEAWYREGYIVPIRN